MSKTNRRYYWIQLAQGFFKSKEMKLLRRMPGGDTYTIIYLKLMLISLEDDGKLFYDSLATDLAEELSLLIDEDIEAIRMTLLFLEKKRLMTRIESNVFFLEQVPEMVGSETASTRRSRKSRENSQKALQCNNGATSGNREIEIEKDIKKEIEKEVEAESQQPQHEYSFLDLCNDFKENLGQREKWTPLKMDDLRFWSQDYGNDLVREALVTAVRQGKSSFAYIKSILINWERDGLTTVELVRNHEEQRQKKLSKQNQKSNVPEWSKPDYEEETLTTEKQAELDEFKQQALERLNRLKEKEEK